ncbi:branched-chain amino acid transport system ATP-binding protein [Mycobacterium frederiksbergense]|uniref:Branched-chain amino acid transport system ATP-binding protein n=1 Tax=Mycolicibacterium frederiksbergense TaxID=117567 RepID=A0ABT6L341_9MYCO|nr:ABC transporter ATP-binding protein [Mycolicibacterium frederiksbergense]MDH6197382.1 branched-chain amino acid transport system ATP-binding protein [Mycolicibacterium frederiksbergense]
MPDTLLEITGLHAGYDATPVVHGVDLQVREGQFAVLIGPNGHGKSTILRAASGLIAPTKGTITLAGQDITRLRPETIAARGLVHIPQGDLLFGDMTVLENLTLGAFLRKGGRAERAQLLERVYDIFPRLAERSGQRARTLSGGERRMVAIGRGLMADARILMIDEPSLGLAPVLVDEVYRKIAEIHGSGLTILLVEENFSRVRDLADRLTLIENGAVRATGTVTQVLSDPAVAATYLGVDS